MREITLKGGAVALVDDADFKRVNAHRWYLDTKGYAMANLRGRAVRMHRFVLDLAPRIPMVDHINRNKLDNRRANLRACTQSENTANSGPRVGRSLKGVYWVARERKWEARITVRGHRMWLGYFPTSFDAACAYDDVAKKEFGVSAHLNFPRRYGGVAA